MSGIYIHIPFCGRRCVYCDFHTGTNLKLKRRYVEALCAELKAKRGALVGDVETIYLGGGTPSLLSEEELDMLFDTLQTHYDLSHVKEVTMECNPDDLSAVYVDMLRSKPINRLSVGIQSFDDGMLRFLNRRHTASEALEAIERCRAARFDNISVDLMYGLPGQSMATWEDTLNTCLAMGVEHVSAYSLMYEEGTALVSLLNRGLIEPLDDEISLAMFERLLERLKEGGIVQYEISNFAKLGYESRHNSSYWEGKPYLGIGAGAHWYTGEERGFNVQHTEQYCIGVEQGSCYWECEPLSAEERFNEYVFTALRTMRGLDVKALSERFPADWVEELLSESQRYVSRGELIYADGVLRLSERGIYVSDGVMSDLMRV